MNRCRAVGIGVRVGNCASGRGPRRSSNTAEPMVGPLLGRSPVLALPLTKTGLATGTATRIWREDNVDIVLAAKTDCVRGGDDSATES